MKYYLFMNKETIFFMILAMWYLNRYRLAKYLFLVGNIL
jgi:hypothetical protein